MGSPEQRGYDHTQSFEHAIAQKLADVLIPAHDARIIIDETPGSTLSYVVWLGVGEDFVPYLPERSLRTPESIPSGVRMDQYHQVHAFHEPGKRGAIWAQFTDRSTGQATLERLYNADAEVPPTVESIIPACNSVPWDASLSKRVTRHIWKDRLTRGAAAILATAVVGTTVYAVGSHPSATPGAEAAPPLPSPSAPEKVAPTPRPAITRVSPPTPTPTPTPSMEPTSVSPLPSPEPPKPTSPPEIKLVPTTEITMTTWNKYYKNKDIESPIAGLMKEVRDPKTHKITQPASQIIAFQEANWLSSKLPAIAKKHNYGVYPGPHAGSTKNLQIIWDKKRLTFVEGHAMHAPSDKGHDRTITWVIFKENGTGRVFANIVMHAPHQVDKNGLPSSKKASVKAHAAYTQKLVEVVKLLQAKNIPVFLLGDGNVASTTDNEKCVTKTFLCQRLGSLMVNMWLKANLSGKNSKLSTHGGGTRLIDYEYYSETSVTRVDIIWAAVHSKNQKMKGGDGGSDHKPVMVTYRLTDSRAYKKTAPSPLTLTGVNNERDVADSAKRIIKSGLLYRSAKLENATSSDRTQLAQLLRNGFIIDLRTVKVRAKDPDHLVNGVADLNMPIDSAASAKAYVKEFVDDASNRKEFGDTITKIAEARGPVLIHCTAGKDRTGWTVAMIMYALGATDKEVMTEYMKSKGSDEKVEEAWLNAALTAAKKKYGSISGYITKGLGVSSTTIAKLARLKA